ncbi:MAG TPA: tripartite tricarboxylate transporter substrate-binding protein [Ramlibacter sp.]|nr:tripartite tricarboxylate transporter substrate-binding protein [Ramlibacter sp.]
MLPSIARPTLTRRAALQGMAATALLGPAHAQQDKLPALAKLLAGFPPGGAIDVISRRLGDSLRGVVADNVIVENKAGAGGRIAIDALRLGPGDGSQWLVTPGSMVVIYPHVYRKLRYDPLRDLLPVAQIGSVAQALAVGPAVPAAVTDVKGFVEWLKAHPGLANVGSPAAGNITHFLTLLFERSAGVKLQHVAYRGSAPAIQDLLGGQLPAVINPITDMLPHLASGKLRVLGVTARQRSGFLPTVATFHEQGFPRVVGSEWIAMFAHAGTPRPLVQRMAAGIRAALQAGAVRESFAKLAIEPMSQDGAGLARQIRGELAGWGEVAKAFGFQLDE